MTNRTKIIPIRYDKSITTSELMLYVDGFRESEDCCEEASALMEQVLGELMMAKMSIKAVMFLFTGLIVTNGLWCAHYLGWL